MSKHTPGPWEASGLTVYDTCMDAVASVHSAADARLIAAAPDLLAALKPFADVDEVELIGAPDDMPIEEALHKAGQPTVGDLRRAMEALAKAEAVP